MPQRKKKNQSDSDTSDSGPDDVNPPPKKSKPDAKSSSKKDDEEPSWTLDKSRAIKVREFKGKLLIDIREYYEKDGEIRPGKKGIALSAMQWRKLVDAVPEIDEAIQRMA